MTAEEKLREELRNIVPADRDSMEKAKQRWKSVGKPLFSLGKLEDAVISRLGNTVLLAVGETEALNTAIESLT